MNDSNTSEPAYKTDEWMKSCWASTKDPFHYVNSLLVKPQCCDKKCLTKVDVNDLRNQVKDIFELTNTMNQREKKMFFRNEVAACFDHFTSRNYMKFKFKIGSRTKVECCRQAFRCVYRMHRDYLNVVSQEIKAGKRNGSSSHTDRSIPFPLNEDQRLQQFHDKWSEMFGLSPTQQQEAGMVIPNTPSVLTCWAWMKYYFELVGDFEPNTVNEIHLEPTTIKSIWEAYKRETIPLAGETLLNTAQFGVLWTACFSHVKIRKFKNVQGKCTTCAILSKFRDECKDQIKCQFISWLLSLHRATYMGERMEYSLRCEQAKRHPELFLSLVTDGMAQSHCILPWQKNLASAVKPTLTQHIQGVLMHGRKTIFYRTFHTVDNTSSLQIHTFLLSLEKIRTEMGVLPDTLYYQIDGGSENTARAVYFLCELIVARRLVKCIKLCRLLVGHTHCDVDAAFANIWTHIRDRHINTPQGYKSAIVSAFRHEVEVEDIFIIPDYKELLDQIGDKNFSNYVKKEQAQLMFIFTAVDVCDNYPTGVKVNYRAYSKDSAIEIVKGNHENFSNGLGVYPVNRPVVTFPIANPDDDAPPGIHLLTKLPCIRKEDVIFKTLKKGSRKQFDDTYASCVKYFGKDSPEIREWDQFGKLLPINDDVEEYVKSDAGRKEVKLPLFEILFTGEVQPPSVPHTITPKTFAVSTDMIPTLPLVDPVKTSRNKRLAGTNTATVTKRARKDNSRVSKIEEQSYDSAESEDEEEQSNDEDLVEQYSDDEDIMPTENVPGRTKEEELTDDEAEMGWITKKRNFEITKNHNSAVLYINRTFTFLSSSIAPENKVGKIVDVVVPVDNRQNLHFKYYNSEVERREKNFKYISCRELLQKDAVKWDIPLRDLTGKGLIGRRVQSLFKVGDVLYWYEGRVISYNSNEKQFLIRYCDKEETSVNLTHLLPMLRRGKPIF